MDETAALCEDWVQEVEDPDGSDADSVADLAESTATFAEDVEALGPPEGIEDEAEEFVSVTDDLAGYTEDVAEVLEEGETPTTTSSTTVVTLRLTWSTSPRSSTWTVTSRSSTSGWTTPAN